MDGRKPVEPQGGATEVDPTEPVVLTFDHAIDPAMVEYAALHEGDVNGPEVAVTWSLSEDSTQLVFPQAEPLKPATRYTVHLGGGMMDSDGHHVDLETNGTPHGRGVGPPGQRELRHGLHLRDGGIADARFGAVRRHPDEYTFTGDSPEVHGMAVRLIVAGRSTTGLDQLEDLT